MSKKKSSSTSTMTLKDFHGGSIPSDLPLPSAPGVTVRPADRPRSSNSIRSLDVRTPFLSNNVHIGRNFDEDERKPLDGNAGPRRTVIDEIITAPPVLGESRSDVGRFLGASPSSKISSPSRTAYPNAWAVRKEPVSVADATPSPYVGHGQSNLLKIAQASALEKVSSGRWQTKPIRQQADVEQVELPSDLHPRASDAYHGMNVRDCSERMLVMQAERNMSMEKSIQNVVNEVRAGERIRSPVLLGGKERISSLSTSSGQLPTADRKFGIPGSQLPAEASERPKLKLLPRTKPLEVSELPSSEHKQEQKSQQPNDSSHLDNGSEVLDNGSEVLGNVNHVKPGLAGGDEGGNRQVERPKLNLKPRSQPLEQAEESNVRPRVTLFCGARPRELVLKERGVDDVVNNEEVVRSPIRVKADIPHCENTVSMHSNAVRHSERAATTNFDHRTGKSINRRERGDMEKAEVRRDNWRSEDWKTRSDAQKQHPLQQETWRKPTEQPKLAKTDASGLRHGKAASAVELAQAFSRSVSNPQQKPAQFSGPHGVPVGTQIPFSRLTGSTTRQQVNGY